MAPLTLSSSVDALLESKDRVVEDFYSRLLSRYPELSRYFENRDLRIQASMVTMALVHVEGFYSHRFPATQHYLQVLGHRHYHVGVRPEDLDRFRDVLLECFAEYLEPAWTDALAAEWKAALDLAISVMLQGYQQDYTF